ncbi:hypothetical protein HUU53_02045 [Candidatus Micrarchaeota archaeon]|nr:hypothetical protein [Candidatus Micrarchaeota archaeon]
MVIKINFDYYRQKRRPNGEIIHEKLPSNLQGWQQIHSIIGETRELRGNENRRRQTISDALARIANNPTRLEQATRVLLENHGIEPRLVNENLELLRDRTQRQRFAEALQHPDVVEAILSQTTGSPVKFYSHSQERRYPQTTGGIIHTRLEVADAFADALRETNNQQPREPIRTIEIETSPTEPPEITPESDDLNTTLNTQKAETKRNYYQTLLLLRQLRKANEKATEEKDKRTNLVDDTEQPSYLDEKPRQLLDDAESDEEYQNNLLKAARLRRLKNKQIGRELGKKIYDARKPILPEEKPEHSAIKKYMPQETYYTIMGKLRAGIALTSAEKKEVVQAGHMHFSEGKRKRMLDEEK